MMPNTTPSQHSHLIGYNGSNRSLGAGNSRSALLFVLLTAPGCHGKLPNALSSRVTRRDDFFQPYIL